MTNFMKLATASTLALMLAACSTTDDKYQVGANDDDGYTNASNPDVELSDAQTFGMDDDDKFETTTGDMAAPMTNIVEAAVATESLSTLVSLVKQAELVETLSSPGPFTVFAPTNDAFSMLPAATVTALTSPEGKEQLSKVLTAHVISGTVTSTDLLAQLTNGRSYTATTVSGDELTF